MSNRSIDPPDTSSISHSFYRRSEADGEHFVVNCVLNNRWLQLDILFSEKPRWLRFIRYVEKPPFNNSDLASLLKPRRLTRQVVDAINSEKKLFGLNLDPKLVSFNQCDFDCYYLYEDAARRLVRHIAESGTFRELTVIGPTE